MRMSLPRLAAALLAVVAATFGGLSGPVRAQNRGPLDFGAITYGRNIHYSPVILMAARVTH